MDYEMNYDDSDLIQDGKRKRLTTEESELLLEAFARNPRPSQDERNEIAQQLGINSRNIQIWFQNRRAKMKRESNDPDLFSIKSSKNPEDQNMAILPVVTAGNFKELCLPKYLDIPIKGQQMSNEDISKNEAIKNFWKKQQENTSESSLTTSPLKYIKTSGKIRKCTTPPPILSQRFNTKKMKKKITSSDLKIENYIRTFDMPDLVPFNDFTKNQNNLNLKNEFSNLNFLSRSIKENNNQGMMKMNHYRSQLDTVATNIDFLFDPNKNLESMELLGSSKRNLSNHLDTFSDIFSTLHDINLTHH